MTMNTLMLHREQQHRILHDPEARKLLLSGEKILHEFEEQRSHNSSISGSSNNHHDHHDKWNSDTESTTTSTTTSISSASQTTSNCDTPHIINNNTSIDIDPHHHHHHQQQQQQQQRQQQQKEQEYIYPIFDASEIVLGPVLGHGGFGIVYEVQDIVLAQNSTDDRTSTSTNVLPSQVHHHKSSSSSSSKDIIIHEDTDSDDYSEHNIDLHETNNDRHHSHDHQNNRHASITNIMKHEPTPSSENDHYYYHSHLARYYMAANVQRKCIQQSVPEPSTSAAAATTTTTTAARYALKRLKSNLSEYSHVRGAIDLAIEVKILSKLHHPNIVKMRGYSNRPLLDLNFFIVMDRLYEILNHRIFEWKQSLAFPTTAAGAPGGGGVNHSLTTNGIKQQSQSQSKATKMKLLQTIKRRFSRHSKEERERVIQDILLQRLIVAYDLAAAFAYMHENNIVYRDIKQENIGFDVRGDVKVFDFGLSKCISPSLRAHDKVTGDVQYGYNLTPLTGSIPYMAPEVAVGKPYDGQCDVYSLSILLWEIVTLKKAFRFIDRHDYMDSVVKNGERPSFPIIGSNTTPISNEMKEIIKDSWRSDPKQRPTMANVTKRLRHELNDKCDGDDKVLRRSIHMNNRSNHSFRVEIQRQRSSGNLSLRRTSSTNFRSDSEHPNALLQQQQKQRSATNLLRKASSRILLRETNNSNNEQDRYDASSVLSLSKSKSSSNKDLVITENNDIGQQKPSYRNGIES